MRPWIHVVSGFFAFATIFACSGQDEPGGPAGDPSKPTDEGRSDAGPGTGPDGSGPTPDGGPEPAKVDTTNESVDVDGVMRDYVLSVPKTYDAMRSYPLIIALHGDGGNAGGFVAFSKLEASTGDEAIIAYTEQSVDLFTPYDQNRDQKLVERVIDALKARYSIHPDKIWGFGYSKGGYQLNELACKRPGLIKAMAVHAGGAPQTRDGNGRVDCPNAVGLPVFVTHGANDDPGGGEFGASYWANRAGCQQTRTPTTPGICEAYEGCEAGKPVVFCVVPNQPHYPMYDEAAAHSWAWFNSL